MAVTMALWMIFLTSGPLQELRVREGKPARLAPMRETLESL